MNKLMTSLLTATLASAFSLSVMAADTGKPMPGAAEHHAASSKAEKPAGAPKKHVAKKHSVKKHASKNHASHDKKSG